MKQYKSAFSDEEDEGSLSDNKEPTPPDAESLNPDGTLMADNQNSCAPKSSCVDEQITGVAEPKDRKR